MPKSKAVDLKSDDLRYGAVVHLPVKRAVKSIAGESVSKFVPCTVCSVAFLTDGDEDWSIGLKIDIAKVLYDQDNLASDVLGALFE